MKLYGHPYSGSARRVQMLCEELGIPYEYYTVKLQEGEQYSAAFLALNPNGKVPVMDDDGFVLWESQAIMRYLADKHAAESWYPKALEARAHIEQWLDWCQTRLGAEASRLAINMLMLREKGNPQEIADAKKWLGKILPVIDQALAKNAYLCGGSITLPDLAAATNVAYLEMCQYDLSSYPHLTRWYEVIKGRPSFAKTAPR